MNNELENINEYLIEKTINKFNILNYKTCNQLIFNNLENELIKIDIHNDELKININENLQIINYENLISFQFFKVI